MCGGFIGDLIDAATDNFVEIIVVAAVAKSLARGLILMCKVLAAELYKEAAKVIASEVAGPPLMFAKAFAAAGMPSLIINKGVLAASVTAEPPSSSNAFSSII